MRCASSLPRLQSRVLLVDHVRATAAPHHLGAGLVLQRLQRVADLHRSPSCGDRAGCADCKTNLSHTIKLLDRFERLCINTTICRHVLISKYLGEADLPACGTSCDTCRKSHDDKPTINGINLCRDILNIIENLRDSAYRSNIIRVFKQIYLRQYKGLFGTQKRSLDMVRKALVHLRINKYIRERVIQLPGTNRSVVTYQLYNKSKTLRDPTSSIQLEI